MRSDSASSLSTQHATDLLLMGIPKPKIPENTETATATTITFEPAATASTQTATATHPLVPSWNQLAEPQNPNVHGPTPAVQATQTNPGDPPLAPEPMTPTYRRPGQGIQPHVFEPIQNIFHIDTPIATPNPAASTDATLSRIQAMRSQRTQRCDPANTLV